MIGGHGNFQGTGNFQGPELLAAPGIFQGGPYLRSDTLCIVIPFQAHSENVALASLHTHHLWVSAKP